MLPPRLAQSLTQAGPAEGSGDAYSGSVVDDSLGEKGLDSPAEHEEVREAGAPDFLFGDEDALPDSKKKNRSRGINGSA